MIARLTGQAGPVKTRSGSKKQDDGTERAWTMRSQDVIVNDFVRTELSLDDDDQGFGDGEFVDCIVDVTARGGFLTVKRRGDWPKEAQQQRRSTPVPA